jgi:hypothetical protein
MSKADKQLKEWAENWRAAGEILEKERREKIRNGDVYFEIKSLNSAFKLALKNSPQTTTSGLVEFQNLIKKLRKND